MNLVDQRVIHITYGPGTILEETPTYITVLFDGSKDGELKKFAYPICFEKFMRLEDVSVQVKIDRKLHSNHQQQQEIDRKEREAFQTMREERRMLSSSSTSRRVNHTPSKSSGNRNANERTESRNQTASSSERLTATINEYERYCKSQYSDVDPELIRRRFVEDYPIDQIPNLSLDEYLIAKEGEGNDRSFCRRMRYELGHLSSMGNVRFNIFGVYHNPNGDVALSITYSNLFGNDINAAFKYIKKQIVKLLEAAEKEDYRTIDEIRLNSSFKYKLITVYYPDLYIPVVTNNVLNEYCNHVNLSINPNDPMIYRNVELRDWKRRNPEMKDWPNSKLMGFCDWLWRSNRYYSR